MTKINGNVPDYKDLENWAASPYKVSPSDVWPDFLERTDAPKRADVFFIHPTTYLCSNHGQCSIMIERNAINRMLAKENEEPFNANIRDQKLNAYTDKGCISMQASVFNASARIFAPRYRQGHLKLFFLEDSKSVREAFDLAYSDIKHAFEYYLKHESRDRPIIIAGHSQGSFLGIRLLQEFFDGTALQQRLVCAYLPGYALPKERFEKLKPMVSAEETGGFVGWRSYQRGHVPPELLAEKGCSFCINPLIWNDTMAKISMGKGISGIENFQAPMPQGLAASIEEGTQVLLVDLPPQMPEKMRRHQNLHLYDYSLFWLSLRHNVEVRIKAFL